MGRSDYFAHALGLCIQCWVPHDTPHKQSCLVLSDSQIDKAITCMSEARFVEIAIASEERWSPYLV
jgi:hypothetical protein